MSQEDPGRCCLETTTGKISTDLDGVVFLKVQA